MSNEQDILDNAPEGAEYISKIGYLWNDGDSWFIYEAATEEWLHLFFHEHDELELNIHSLADIKRIAELEKERDVRDLEQQAKGAEDFFKSHKPRISMGKSAIWEVDDVLVDEAIAAVDEAIAALKEQGE